MVVVSIDRLVVVGPTGMLAVPLPIVCATFSAIAVISCLISNRIRSFYRTWGVISSVTPTSFRSIVTRVPPVIPWA